MNITVNGRSIELNFGIRFVRELNKNCHIVIGGKQVGTGLDENIPMLFTGDVIALANIIYAATWGVEKRPTKEELDDYLDRVEDIDALFDGVLEELKNQNATRRVTLALVAELEKRKKAEEALRKTQKIMKNSTKP